MRMRMEIPDSPPSSHGIETPLHRNRMTAPFLLLMRPSSLFLLLFQKASR